MEQCVHLCHVGLRSGLMILILILNLILVSDDALATSTGPQGAVRSSKRPPFGAKGVSEVYCLLSGTAASMSVWHRCGKNSCFAFLAYHREQL